MAALDSCEQAIRYAAQTSMIQYQALANELYARFWRDRQQVKAAAVFMTEARDNYAQGAPPPKSKPWNTTTPTCWNVRPATRLKQCKR
jgi:hypothetical protein